MQVFNYSAPEMILLRGAIRCLVCEFCMNSRARTCHESWVHADLTLQQSSCGGDSLQIRYPSV